MLPTTREWVLKAEGDYDVISVLLRSRKPSRYDAICFHAQQCAEKYLKGRLVEAGVAFAKIHHLPALLNLALTIQPKWSVLAGSFTVLTKYSVLPRYPGMSATGPDARTAVATCRRFRKLARKSLGLR